jgi:protein SCO1
MKMTDTENDAGQPASMSEDERRQAFAEATRPGDRGAFRQPRLSTPPKFVIRVASVFLALALAGVLIEHFAGSGPSATTHATTTTVGPARGPTMADFMGLKALGAKPAAPFTLRDQRGHPWSIADARGRAVVLAFFDTRCRDICPVLGAEIRLARARLGARASSTQFVIVNTNPRHVGVVARPAALSETGLAGSSSVLFLTGPLNQLNRVWIRYGVTITVGIPAHQIAHNNVMYFIDPQGRLRELAVPFGDEGPSGTYSLAAAQISRFAQGIAQVAGSLVK